MRTNFYQLHGKRLIRKLQQIINSSAMLVYSLHCYGGQKCANEGADFAAIIRSGSTESGDSGAFGECSSVRLVQGVRSIQVPDTVNSLLATTSRKRPSPVSNHFVNNRFAIQSNIAYVVSGFDVSARASKRRISRNSRSRVPGQNRQLRRLSQILFQKLSRKQLPWVPEVIIFYLLIFFFCERSERTTRRSRGNEARSAAKKITSGGMHREPHFHADFVSYISPNRF